MEFFLGHKLLIPAPILSRDGEQKTSTMVFYEMPCLIVFCQVYTVCFLVCFFMGFGGSWLFICLFFTLQVLCVNIMAFCFVFSWVSCVDKHGCLHLLCFLCFFFCSLSSVSQLFCPILVCLLLFHLYVCFVFICFQQTN